MYRGTQTVDGDGDSNGERSRLYGTITYSRTHVNYKFERNKTKKNNIYRLRTKKKSGKGK